MRPFKLNKKRRIIEVDGQKINYEVKRRKVKNARLQISSRNLKLTVILPKGYKGDEEDIIARYIDWISEHYKHIYSIVEKNLKNKFFTFGRLDQLEVKGDYINLNRLPWSKKEFLFSTRSLLRYEINKIVERYSKIMKIKGIKADVSLKKLEEDSFSSGNTIIFNLKLVSLPKELIEYVVYRKLLDVVEKKKGRDFVKTIRKEFKDVESREKDFENYWSLLAENKIWKKLGY